MKKTYGAKGLMEWECLIKVGKATLHVPFTGGSQTEYGVVPAKFTTDNAVKQAIIERSDYFKHGRIVLLNGDTKKKLPKVESAESDTADAKTSEAKEEKSFATLADAKEWLSQEYGVQKNAVKTIADAQNIGKANGVSVHVGRDTVTAQAKDSD